jgi:hypothetical protein
MGQGTFDESLSEYRLVGPEAVEPALVDPETLSNPGPGEMAHPAGDDAQSGVGGEGRHLELQSAGVADVVGVHAGQELSPAVLETGIEGRHQSLCRGVKKSEAGIPGLPAGEDLGCFVRGAVVHSHHLEALEGLAPQALQAE